MPASGITLSNLMLRHPDAPGLQQALVAIGLEAMEVTPGPATLTALLDTPLGPRTLTSFY